MYNILQHVRERSLILLNTAKKNCDYFQEVAYGDRIVTHPSEVFIFTLALLFVGFMNVDKLFDLTKPEFLF